MVDPRAVSKLPMARAESRGGAIAISPNRPATATGPLRLFAASGRLDVDTVCRLIDEAKVIVEGRVYEAGVAVGALGSGAGPVFLGTALMTIELGGLQLDDGPVEPGLVRRLRDALAADRRTHQVMHDRAWRETARLLGPETPATLEITPTLRTRGTTLLVDLDLEGPLDDAARG